MVIKYISSLLGNVMVCIPWPALISPLTTCDMCNSFGLTNVLFCEGASGIHALEHNITPASAFECKVRTFFSKVVYFSKIRKIEHFSLKSSDITE